MTIIISTISAATVIVIWFFLGLGAWVLYAWGRRHAGRR